MRGAERNCRARGNYSLLYKCFWYQGEPEQRCARKHGFVRSSISWLLESVDVGAEKTRDQVTRPVGSRGCDCKGSRFIGTQLSWAQVGQVGDPCQKPMLRNFLPKPDAFTEEDMVLVSLSTIANRCERQIVSVS